MTTAETRRRPQPPTLAGWAALAVHAGVGVFPYSASGLLAPGGGVLTLGLIWLALAALAVRLRRSWWALAVPPGALAAWAAVMLLGDRLLGWTA
jgi:hypothetical protein